MPEILVCAATRTETEACLSGIRQAGLESHFEVLRTGIGPLRAGETLKGRLSVQPKPALIISSGFAGSWSSELDAGMWITASIVANELGNQIGNLRPVDDAVVTVLFGVAEIFEKPPRILLENVVASDRLPAAVDMESFALAQIAQRRGIPFQVLRYVTDSPAHPLPEFVRDFTAVAVERSLAAKSRALAQGLGSLLKKPKTVPDFLREGMRWRSELTQGWGRFARSLQA